MALAADEPQRLSGGIKNEKTRGRQNRKKHALRIVIIILLVVVFLSIPLVIVAANSGR